MKSINKKPTFEEFGYQLGSFSPICDTGNIKYHMRGMSFGTKPAYVVENKKDWRHYSSDKSTKAQKENKRRMGIAKLIYDNNLISKQPFFANNRDLELEIKRISWEKKILYIGVSQNGLKYIDEKNRKATMEWELECKKENKRKNKVFNGCPPKPIQYLPPKNGKLSVSSFINAVLTNNIKINGIEISWSSPTIS